MNKLDFTNQDYEKKINFFNKFFLKVSKEEKLEENKYLIYSYKNYVITFYDLDFYNNLKELDDFYEFIHKSGFLTDEIIDYGIVPDYELSYKLVEYHEEESLENLLESMGKDQQVRYGQLIGQRLNNLHSIKTTTKVNEENTWYKSINERSKNACNTYCKTNILGFEYIFEDIINENIHFLRKSAYGIIHGSLDLKNIRIDNEGQIFLLGLKDYDYGDPIYDLAFLERIGIVYPDFANSFLNSYFDYNIPRQVFKKMAIYSSLDALERLSNRMLLSEGDRHNLEMETKEFAKNLSEMDNFIPSWYKGI